MISTVRRAMARILAVCSIAALLIPATSAGEYLWYQYESKHNADGYDTVAHHTPYRSDRTWDKDHDAYDECGAYDDWADCEEWQDCEDYGDCDDYDDYWE